MKKIILFITAWLSFSAIINAQRPGDFDSSFGINGTVSTNFISLAGLTQYRTIAIQADGKPVVAGNTQNGQSYSLALARYNVDGSIDTSFSTDGKVTADSFTARVVAIQKDGKILVAGTTLARYNTDGSLDSTFSQDGKITEKDFY